jgi:hypothetical protein
VPEQTGILFKTVLYVQDRELSRIANCTSVLGKSLVPSARQASEPEKATQTQSWAPGGVDAGGWARGQEDQEGG